MTTPASRGVSILGSTGSIGTTTLELVSRFPDRFRVVALAAGRRVSDLKDQIARFKPELVSIADPQSATALREAFAGSDLRVVSGEQGLCDVATAKGTDILVSALVGAVGVPPTLAAIDASIDVGLANKEVMVVAGELVCSRAKASGVSVLPIDSEHNAIFQALEGRRREHVSKIVLTASGGPFRRHSAEALRTVTRAEALAHPTWDMGDKISIDSATLMNKGLEVIEAKWFFDAPTEMIDVIVHPQSIVHSMVRYYDGSVIAVMAIPDMTIPVAHVLAYPDLLDLDHLPALDLAAAAELHFEEPDTDRFPCLRLAFDALRAGGTMPAVTNGANEVAVARFLAGDLAFLDIPACVEAAMTAHEVLAYEKVEELYAVDAWARAFAENFASVQAVG